MLELLRLGQILHCYLLLIIQLKYLMALFLNIKEFLVAHQTVSMTCIGIAHRNESDKNKYILPDYTKVQDNYDYI